MLIAFGVRMEQWMEGSWMDGAAAVSQAVAHFHTPSLFHTKCSLSFGNASIRQPKQGARLVSVSP